MNTFKFIRRFKREISAVFTLAMVANLGAPLTVEANIYSDQQTEHTPFGGSGGDFVNLATGDLNYSLPLMTMIAPQLGYQINLNYNSADTKMMTSPGMMGLGWRLSMGSISRNVVGGVADDIYKGEFKYKQHIKEYVSGEISIGEDKITETSGLAFSLPGENAENTTPGIKSLSGAAYVDNYNGLGVRVTANMALYGKKGGVANAGASVTYDTKTGVSIGANYSYGPLSAGSSFNFKNGIQSINAGATLWSLGFSQRNLLPGVNKEMRTQVVSGDINLALASTVGDKKVLGEYIGVPLIPKFSGQGHLSSIKYTDIRSEISSESFSKIGNGYLYRKHASTDQEIRDFIRYNQNPKKESPFLDVTQLGKDVFVQSDQGSGGAFTVETSEFEIWRSQMSQSVTNKDDFGLEIGIDATKTHFGVGINYTAGQTVDRSGPVRSISLDNSVLNYENEGAINARMIKGGEIQIEDGYSPDIKNWGGERASRFLLQKGSYDIDDVNKTDSRESSGGNSNHQAYTIDNSIYQSGNTTKIGTGSRTGEMNKYSYTQMLTTADAKKFGINKGSSYFASSESNKTNRSRHIAEINVMETDNLIYSYAEPVYNFKTKDVMFSIDNTLNKTGVGINETMMQIPDGNTEGVNNTGEVKYGKCKELPGKAGWHKGMEILDVKESPEYASSWLISSITSKDYYDTNGDGKFSSEDAGSWMVFKYKKAYDDENNPTTNVFNYRTPYEGIQVTNGRKGESADDMGFYRYGEKELKYIESIESKTHIAVFEYGDRKDGIGVKNDMNHPNGGMDNSVNTVKQKYLKRIILKLKNDGNGVVLQTVNFNYSYELCPDVPDNDGQLAGNIDHDFNPATLEVDANLNRGKLTLKEVYTTFKDSNKGENYRYQFDYGDLNIPPSGINENNPSFNQLNTDRWSEYKRNDFVEPNDPPSSMPNFSNPDYPIFDYPQVEQNISRAKSNASSYVAPWTLKAVDLPTGARIMFDYQEKDYQFVSDKTATQFFDILSVQSFDDLSTDAEDKLEQASDRNKPSGLNGEYFEDELDKEDHVIIKLSNPEYYDQLVADQKTTAEINEEFFDQYLSEIYTELNIKAYVYLDAAPAIEINKEERKYDYVDVVGHLESNDYEVKKIGSNWYAQIRLKGVGPMSVPDKIHPIRFAGFEKIKSERMDILNGDLESNLDLELVDVARLFSSLVNQSFKMWSAFYANRVRLNGWSKIRLRNPEGKKFGGGSRVKSVTLNDNYDPTGLGGDKYNYKQVYEYTLEDGTSSGVATEPQLGREENADFKLYVFKEETFLAEPILHTIKGNPLDVYNPGPSVNYSRITVKNEYPDAPEDTNNPGVPDVSKINLSRAPHTVYEFFTYKDFPVVKDFTKPSIGKDPYAFSLNIPSFTSQSVYDNARSQGYAVTKSDMPGKLRSIQQLTRDGKNISYQTYNYATTNLSYSDWTIDRKRKEMSPSAGSANVPDNKINVVGKLNEVNTANVGLDYDIWLDANENSSNMHEVGYVQFNIMPTTVVPYIDWMMPLFFLPQNFAVQNDKTFVLNKVINKKGILKKVTTTKDESRIETDYLLYDSKTAAPVLTRVENEFNDKIYKFTKPAHWEYEKFDGAFHSMDIEFSMIPSANGNYEYAVPNADELFIVGDKIKYVNHNNGGIGFGYVDEVTSTYVKFIEEETNDPITVQMDNFRVIRSGNNNLINTTVGEIVCEDVGLKIDEAGNIDLGNGNPTSLTFDKVLNASAITFKDQWPVKCCYGNAGITNPYLIGSKNNWLPYRSYVLHQDRQAANNSSYTKSGEIIGFVPFEWTNPDGHEEWVMSSEAVEYDSNGNLIEQKDALGISSMSTYGYGDIVVTTVIANSSQEEAGFDGFEETTYETCDDQGKLTLTDASVPLENGGSNDAEISDNQAHTGKYSLKIAPGTSYKIKKIITSCEGVTAQ